MSTQQTPEYIEAATHATETLLKQLNDFLQDPTSNKVNRQTIEMMGNIKSYLKGRLAALQAMGDSNDTSN